MNPYNNINTHPYQSITYSFKDVETGKNFVFKSSQSSEPEDILTCEDQAWAIAISELERIKNVSK